MNLDNKYIGDAVLTFAASKKVIENTSGMPKQSLFDQIDMTNVPKHTAIIMDGNGRWAKSQGKERIFGHFNGVEAVRAAIKAATRCGVEYLTLYAFSTENWNRPKEEVEALMNLLVTTIVNELDELHQNNVRLHTIGDVENLPENCRIELENGKQRTASNTKLNLVLALNYSSRWEIVTAIQQMIKNNVKAEDVDVEMVSSFMTTNLIPDPELLIRTSGERRISNFLLWQIAYAELYFTDTLWPDFREDDFYTALLDYQGRERRFGQTSEQIQELPFEAEKKENGKA